MLQPNERELFMEQLRPPAGHVLHTAVGTTYSLDLYALLAVPLAFTYFSCEDRDGNTIQDPLALLEALRRYAGRMSVFCHAGGIHVPPRHQQLLAYVEKSVVQVLPPRPDRNFHPKVWVLRYVAENGDVAYRVLCQSRNLTFDRSWDTIAVLDGQLDRSRRNAFSKNRPLSDFVSTLPKLAVTPPAGRVQEQVDLVADEVLRVKFSPPLGFSDFAWIPIGISPRYSWPFPRRVNRLAVVSPFADSSLLAKLADMSRGQVALVSSEYQLGSLPPQVLREFSDVLYMLPEADAEGTEETQAPDMDDSGDSNAGAVLEVSDAPAVLSGLHAKLYVADVGWKAQVWTGSANATSPAFGGNVEFMVRFDGRKVIHGVEALLGFPENGAGFRSLLAEFPLQDREPELDQTREDGERRLREGRNLIAQAGFTAQLEPLLEGSRAYSVALVRRNPWARRFPCDVTGRCWPVSLRPELSVGLATEDPVVARFPRLSFEGVTSFFAFELSLCQGADRQEVRFVLNVPLEGEPPDREQEVLRQILQSRERFLRFLMLLLSDSDMDVSRLFADNQSGTGAWSGAFGGMDGEPLLERLLGALARHPARLSHVASLVEELRATPQGRDLLPPDFDLIWPAVAAVYEELGR
jgi:hypothetical protein